ncbi:MAG: hypothetical protein JNG86_12315 [Verrucomicrobiaceae bacterium]|nr:hypothetical protein [Verrucomicrobiaceae bacterium]
MSSTPPTKPRRRWLRWLALALLAGLIAAAGFVWWAWRERVMLVNLALDRVMPQIVIEVKELGLEDGAVHLTGVRAWWRADGAEITTVNQAHWQPKWRDLREGALGTVKLEGAVIDADLSRLGALSSSEKSAGGTIWRLDEIEFEETPLALRDEKGALLVTKVAARVEGLEIGGAAPRMKLADVRARDVVWRDKPMVADLKLTAKTTDDGVEVLSLHAADGTVDVGTFLDGTDETHRPHESSSSPVSHADAWPRRVLILDAHLQNLRVTANDVHGLTGALRFTWRGREIAWERGAPLKLDTQMLDLTELALRPARGAGEITADSLHAEADGLENLRSVRLSAPRVRWTQALEDALISEGGSESKTHLKIGSVSIEKGDLAFEATQRLPVSGSLKWNAELRELEIGDSGLKSPQKQQIAILELKAAWGKLEPFLNVKSITAEIIPDVLRERHWVDALTIEEPRVTLNPENGPWFEKIAAPLKPVIPEVPLWKRFGFGKLVLNAAAVRASLPLAERVEMEAALEVRPADAGMHQLHVTRAQATVPARPGVPVASVRDVMVEARLPEMWNDRRIEKIDVHGGHVDVGDALMGLFITPEAQKAEEKAKAVAERWTARRVDVQGISVTLEEIAPKFPPVNFSVEFDAQDTPLDLEGLAENVEPKQVVLRNLRIPSPFRPLNAVAEMNVIQVTYTLDGLLHRRIDRVDILAPMLFVGEDMFWYVDNYRKFIYGVPEVPDAFVGPVMPPKPKPPGWRVDTLAVSGGRLVVAPKGTPIEGLGEPFPFSFSTKLDSGELNAELLIPNEDREIAKVKLRFKGLRGKVQFNLPMKEKNNNVVEVFQADRVQWKNLFAENTNLSVTYDRNGIYGSFYAKAYEGDVNGAFNIYMDDAYTWDGWLALTKIRSGPVTMALFPEYFLLDGTVSGKVIATGDSDDLYQGDAEFRNDGSGRFEVSALNDVIKDLPKPMRGDLSEQIQRIGLETLRDFDYDSVDGKARFYGREGTGHLRFAGPDGRRTIEIRVFDHQWKGGTVKDAE